MSRKALSEPRQGKRGKKEALTTMEMEINASFDEDDEDDFDEPDLGDKVSALEQEVKKKTALLKKIRSLLPDHD